MMTVSPEIRQMEPDLVAQIKAGEVIERPASVVKELLENAIDAGASRIRVDLQDGGIALIRVVDDGCGIDPESLALAFEEHTSSKLHASTDLETISTLGFRGEALYAISNVARVEAISGIRGEPSAWSVTLDHGDLVSDEPAAPGGGTRFTVLDLFSRVPARRKHLRSPRSETAVIHQVVGQYAVAHPSIAVSLVSDGRTLVSSPGSGRIDDAFAAVFGFDLVDKMLPVSREGTVQVKGLVSPPTLSRRNRTAILLFVNGRPIRSAALMFAIEDAMSGLLMVGRHPLAALSIGLPADQIDPNVHPTKQEVRFLADRQVFATVREAVSDALGAGVAVAQPTAKLRDEDVGSIWGGTPIPQGSRPDYPAGVVFNSAVPSSAEPEMLFQQALPKLRVFGQAALTFIVAEGPSGLYMIDQHAAHERVLFDQLSSEDTASRQPLLAPESVQLTSSQLDTLETHGDLVRSCGLDVDPFDAQVCLVRAVPVVGGRTVSPTILPELLEALAEARSPDGVLKEVLTVVACKAAVKAGESLSMNEMRALVEALESTPNPRTCPHGRPTTIHLSTERLEREFGRR